MGLPAGNHGSPRSGGTVKRPRLAVRVLAALLLLCRISGVNAQPRSSDVTARSGVDFRMTCGDMPAREILEVNGGGVAMIDVENDGDLDLFFANGARMAAPDRGPGCRLYVNDGHGVFREVTQEAGINITRWANGVAVGDYDADGFDDLYITCYGADVLLRNQSGRDASPRFADVTSAAGLGDARWSTSAAFGDVDADGDLDLYVANYLDFDISHPPPRRQFKGVAVMAGPKGLTPQHDVLYENLGDGRFRDITTESGCRPQRAGYGLVVQIADLDRDGRQDIFVGNDSTENFFFHNLGQRRFREMGLMSGLSSDGDGDNQATMGVAVADVDDNGLPDLFSTSFSDDSDVLHLNMGRGLFEDRTSQFGLGLITRPFLSWACGFYDFDLDADEDLFITQGHVYPEAATGKIDSDYAQPPLLFERDGRRFRRNMDAAGMLRTPIHGRAAAFGDLDGDGDVDIVLTTLNGPVQVLRNEAAGGNRLVVELRQSGGNRRAYGSVVEAACCGRTQRRWLTGGGSFQAVNAPAAYFGCRHAANAASQPSSASLTITWPDGTATKVGEVGWNQRVIVDREGTMKRVALRRE